MNDTVVTYDKTGPWTWANAITYLRVVGMIAGPAIYLWGNPKVGVVVLLVAGATDWMDGFVARQFHQSSKFGATLDPVVDKLFMLVAGILTAYVLWSSFAGCMILVVIVTPEASIALSALKHWRLTHTALEVVWIGKVGMFLRMPAIVLLLWSTTMSAGPAHGTVMLFAAILALAGLVAAMGAAGEYAAQTYRANRILARIK
jgi:CDP-diacylglycerol--glycerol-3-phosphate 3-phosphatidyltransferase